MRVSLVVTVLNEAASIKSFLASVHSQSVMPDELVVVDGGSTDGTVEMIHVFMASNPSLRIVCEIHPGNRSVGRNAAIALARNDIIAVTDAGTILDHDWLKHIIQPFIDTPTVSFVGGWYQPIIDTAWDASLAMVFGFDVHRVSEDSFLPSTRSMAFKKSAWYAAGGFDVSNSDSEDTPFSMHMRKVSEFAFAPSAIVHWHLIRGYRRLYRTFERYARGDGQMHIWQRHYVFLLVGVVVEFSLILAGVTISPIALLAGAGLALAYILLPLIRRGYRRTWRSVYQVPAMKTIIIFANIIGFIHGLTRTST